MADFCATCTETVMGAPRELNDFRHSWPHGWAVVLCEGCGMHVVNQAGERLCGDTPDLIEPIGSVGACKACVAAVNVEDWGTR